MTPWSPADGRDRGILTGKGWQILDKVVIGAIAAFDGTLLYQAHQATPDALGLLLGAIGGSAGAVLPVPGAQAGVKGFALTTADNVGQGVATTTAQAGLIWIFGHGK